MVKEDNKNVLLLMFDLYWLRFCKPSRKWYELTDYLREKLIEDGHSISYTKDDLIFDGYSMKRLLSVIKKPNK